jgi:hypothetical protein
MFILKSLFLAYFFYLLTAVITVAILANYK